MSAPSTAAKIILFFSNLVGFIFGFAFLALGGLCAGIGITHFLSNSGIVLIGGGFVALGFFVCFKCGQKIWWILSGSSKSLDD